MRSLNRWDLFAEFRGAACLSLGGFLLRVSHERGDVMALWPTPEMEHEAQLAKLGVRLKLERAVIKAAMVWSRKK